MATGLDVLAAGHFCCSLLILLSLNMKRLSVLLALSSTFALAQPPAAPVSGVPGGTTTPAVSPEVNMATTPTQRPEPGWMKRHERFNEISKEGKAQVVFFGDSITQGWEGPGKVVWDKYWAPLEAANFGIGGDRTEHLLWRLDNGNFDGLKPRLVVLMIGTNNTGHQGRNGYHCTPEQTSEGVKAIIERLRKKVPGVKVLLLGIFPRGETPEDRFRKQNETINALLKLQADGKDVIYMDIGGTFLKEGGMLPREVMPDLLHLSPSGYELWAKAIDAKVKELLQAGQ